MKIIFLTSSTIPTAAAVAEASRRVGVDKTHMDPSSNLSEAACLGVHNRSGRMRKFRHNMEAWSAGSRKGHRNAPVRMYGRQC